VCASLQRSPAEEGARASKRELTGVGRPAPTEAEAGEALPRQERWLREEYDSESGGFTEFGAVKKGWGTCGPGMMHGWEVGDERSHGTGCGGEGR